MGVQRRKGYNLRAFGLLLALVIVGGVWLWTRGELRSPLQSISLVLSVGETGAPAAPAERPAPAANPVQRQPASSTPQLSLEEFSAALSAEGVDVEAVKATMQAEGRSLENLLVVVNSGRVSVVDLAARLKGESASPEAPASAPEAPSSLSLGSIHWEDLGSVLYNLWVMLATTVLVIVVARPLGWLAKRLKMVRPRGAQRPSA